MNKKKELMTNHKFTFGITATTEDWGIKNNHEVRLFGNGYKHVIVKYGGFKETCNSIASLEDLEIFIYKNYLNEENVPRLFTPIIVITPSKPRPKRRAKRVNLLLKIA